MTGFPAIGRPAPAPSNAGKSHRPASRPDPASAWPESTGRTGNGGRRKRFVLQLEFQACAAFEQQFAEYGAVAAGFVGAVAAD